MLVLRLLSGGSVEERIAAAAADKRRVADGSITGARPRPASSAAERTAPRRGAALDRRRATCCLCSPRPTAARRSPPILP